MEYELHTNKPNRVAQFFLDASRRKICRLERESFCRKIRTLEWVRAYRISWFCEFVGVLIAGPKYWRLLSAVGENLANAILNR
jgi:hypothetical protein